jgi:hypothetical protein
VRGEPLLSAGGAARVLSGRCSRPLRAERRVKALAAEERIAGRPLRPRARDADPGVVQSPDVTCADRGAASAGLGVVVIRGPGLGCDVVVEVEDVGGVVAALDIP